MGQFSKLSHGQTVRAPSLSDFNRGMLVMPSKMADTETNHCHASLAAHEPA